MIRYSYASYSPQTIFSFIVIVLKLTLHVLWCIHRSVRVVALWWLWGFYFHIWPTTGRDDISVIKILHSQIFRILSQKNIKVMVVCSEPEKTIRVIFLSCIRQTENLHLIISASSSYPVFEEPHNFYRDIKILLSCCGTQYVSIDNAESCLHQLFHSVCRSNGAGKSDGVSLELQNVNLIINHLLSVWQTAMQHIVSIYEW